MLQSCGNCTTRQLASSNPVASAPAVSPSANFQSKSALSTCRDDTGAADAVAAIPRRTTPSQYVMRGFMATASLP